MKKINRGALALLLITLALPSQAAVRVLATTADWGALAKELGGDRVDVYTATTAMQDVHRVEAKPSLVARARTADLLVSNGAELEVGWLPVLLQESANPRIQRGAPGFFEATSAVTLAEVPAKLDRAMGDIHPLGNPHIQLDPRNVAAVAKALTNRLSAVDPAGAETYAARGADFAKRWTEALARWEAKAAPLQRRAGRDHAPGPGLSAALARPQGARRHRAGAGQCCFCRWGFMGSVKPQCPRDRSSWSIRWPT